MLTHCNSTDFTYFTNGGCLTSPVGGVLGLYSEVSPQYKHDPFIMKGRAALNIK